MATPLTSVQLEGMTAAQADFQAALDQVNTAYNDMTEEQSTLAANWTGEAASSFGNALGTYLSDMSVVQQQLSMMLEKLHTHTGVYANTHEQSQEMASAFQQGLGALGNLPGLPGF
jgi:WXG100 family type VII secretion target